MYRLRPPSADQIRAFIAQEAIRPAYPVAAEVPDPPPRGFRANRGGGLIGRGSDDFATARSAMRERKMFPGGWVWVESDGQPVHLGQTVAVIAPSLGLWTMNCCRVTDVTDTDRTFAFTYATTAGHGMAGAERFRVEWRADDTVWFDVYSIARPRDLLIWLGYPLLRHLQKRFAAEAPLALRRAVEQQDGTPPHRTSGQSQSR